MLSANTDPEVERLKIKVTGLSSAKLAWVFRLI